MPTRSCLLPLLLLAAGAAARPASFAPAVARDPWAEESSYAEDEEEQRKAASGVGTGSGGSGGGGGNITNAPTPAPTPHFVSECKSATSCRQCMALGAVDDDYYYSTCVWCSGSDSCTIIGDPHCEGPSDPGDMDPCGGELGNVTFIVSVAALGLFCFCSSALKRYSRQHGGAGAWVGGGGGGGANAWGAESLRAPLVADAAMRDTMLEMGHLRWRCRVCAFENLPAKDECVMCAAPRHVIGERDGDAAGGGGGYVAPGPGLGEEGGGGDGGDGGGRGWRARSAKAIAKLNPIRASPSKAVPIGGSAAGGGMRRLAELSQRQRGSRRRKLWVRRFDADGVLRWHRRRKGETQVLDLDGGGGGSGSDSGEAEDEAKGGEGGGEGGGGGGESAAAAGGGRGDSLRDTFNDTTMLSSSPGFITSFGADGAATWTEATLVELGRRGEEGAASVDWDAVAALAFSEKWSWLLTQLGEMQLPWSDGHVKLRIRRASLLDDSFAQFGPGRGGCNAAQLHKWLRVQFEGEPAIDAGGLEREWFQLVVEALFEPALGLFVSTHATEAVAYAINPASASSSRGAKQHLAWFRFTGRVIGKAVMEQQLLAAYPCLPLLKHVLGVPITLSDLEFIDAQLYASLLWMREHDGAEHLCLDFTLTVQERDATTGEMSTREHELVPGGGAVPVTDDNKREYIGAVLRYRMLDSVAPQLHALLEGLFEVVPRELLSVFDYQELEVSGDARQRR